MREPLIADEVGAEAVENEQHPASCRRIGRDLEITVWHRCPLGGVSLTSDSKVEAA